MCIIFLDNVLSIDFKSKNQYIFKMKVIDQFDSLMMFYQERNDKKL